MRRPAKAVVSEHEDQIMTNIENTAQTLEALNTLIAKLRADIQASAPAPAPSANAAAEDSLVKALHDASGHATVADLMTACSMTKGTAWRHINSLERQARVWLRVTHRADGRKHTIVYDADHVAA